MKKGLLLPCRQILFWLLLGFLVVQGRAATLPFQFTLDETATTSAGIYRTDGTLVRTLWRKVEYDAGVHSANWDGLNDQGTSASPGDYQVKMIVHHAGYVWDGTIGNTSAVLTGSTVHRASYPIRDLTIQGTNVFYINGYSENAYDFKHFLTSDPQRVDDRWTWYVSTYNGAILNHSSAINDRNWIAADTDGTWVYFASPNSRNPASLDEDTSPGFVTASLVSDHTQAYFTNGIPIVNGVGADSYPNGIRVGTQPGVSGMAVQRSGNYLAVAVKPDNKVYLLDKRTGAAVRSFSVAAPGPLAFAPNGDLWVLSGTTAKRYSNSSNSLETNITGLQQPLDIAVNPLDSSVAVVDAGNSQQVKAWSSTGTALWTLGQAGGYSANGPTVTTDKFIFYDRDLGNSACLTFGADGSLWLGDSGNRRLLHYDANRTYLEQIMSQPSTYSTSIEAGDPTRVFSGFLEFKVDYSKPLAQGWSLVKNWSANLPASYFPLDSGMRNVATLSNGRTYGVVSSTAQPQRELVELTTSGLRLTPIRLASIGDQSGKVEYFTSTGSIRRADIFDATITNAPGTRTVFDEKPLTGFDTDGNPQWGAFQILATCSAEATDPVNRCCSLGDFNIPLTSSGFLLSFDPTKTNSWHLGAVSVGATEWLWKAAPTVTSNVPLDGLGSFDIGDDVQYPGNSVFVAGRQVVYGYHGEFWDDAQAAQFMHYLDNGLFIGQFGEPSIGHESFEGTIPGYAGNSAFSTLISVGNDVYLWVNDESQHGPQRWHFTGTRTIREGSGTGTLGQTTPLVLTLPPAGFPIKLQALPGSQRASVTWQEVPHATSYNIKSADLPGGPWTLLAGGIQGAGHTLTNLVNGKKIYITVSAMVNGQESPDADPISVTPFDQAITVEKAGQYDQPGIEPSIYTIDDAAPPVGKPALRNLNPLLADLPLLSVGSGGYRTYKWNTTDHSDRFNFPTGDPTSNYQGWTGAGFMSLRSKVSGVVGDNWGLVVGSATTPGTFDLNPGDTDFHYLTLVVPAIFRDPRQSQVSIQPQGHPESAVTYSLNDSRSLNHLLQFRFKGPITLTFKSIIGTLALQDLFLDRVPVIANGTTGFQLWQQQNFSNTGLSDPSADPDADGIANLLEYAEGTAPLDPTGRRPPNSQILTLGGLPYLTLSFIRDRSAAVTCQVGVSSDLKSWTWLNPDDPLTLVAKVSDTPAIGLDTLTVRDIVPADIGPRFMQLKASLP